MMLDSETKIKYNPLTNVVKQREITRTKSNINHCILSIYYYLPLSYVFSKNPYFSLFLLPKTILVCVLFRIFVFINKVLIYNGKRK